MYYTNIDGNIIQSNRKEVLKKLYPKAVIKNAGHTIDEYKEGKYILKDDEMIFNSDYQTQIEVIKKEKEITQLQDELRADDYKIIKCFELQLTNKPLPYNIEDLHTQRQIKRERINELQKQLSV